VLPQPRSLPRLSMVDQDAQEFGLDQLQGQWTIVFMGFTNCGHVCPMAMAKLRAIKDTMQQPMQVLFVSVDPGRDTPAVIRDYVHGFDPDFSGITGADQEIAQLANALGAPYFVDNSGDSYVVDHSSAFFIINPDGAFAAVISAPHKAESVAADLDKLLSAG
jgi:protein SCO1/2